jgi:hypothetical protein
VSSRAHYRGKSLYDLVRPIVVCDRDGVPITKQGDRRREYLRKKELLAEEQWMMDDAPRIKWSARNR